MLHTTIAEWVRFAIAACVLLLHVYLVRCAWIDWRSVINSPVTRRPGRFAMYKDFRSSCFRVSAAILLFSAVARTLIVQEAPSHGTLWQRTDFWQSVLTGALLLLLCEGLSTMLGRRTLNAMIQADPAVQAELQRRIQALQTTEHADVE